MTLNRTAPIVVLAALPLLGSAPAHAHIPFIEPEARAADPASLPAAERAAGDYSFSNPFPLADDRAFQDQHDFAFDGIDSMAINAYLSPGDVDVYRVVPAANEGFIFPAILASALSPACAELVDAYPVIALVGPGLPRDPELLAQLPFDIDEAAAVPQPASGKNGVLYAANPRLERRELFVEDVVTGLSWFLPKGLTQECLEPPGNPFVDCETFDNSIVATAQDGMVVGEAYYVAIWDPAGKAQDYTMNLGVTDAHYVDRPEINAEIECFSLIHGECSQPYPDQPAPDGYFSPLCATAPADAAPDSAAADAGPPASPDPDAGPDGSSSAGVSRTEDTSGCRLGPSGVDDATPAGLAIFLAALLVSRRRRRSGAGLLPVR